MSTNETAETVDSADLDRLQKLNLNYELLKERAGRLQAQLDLTKAQLSAVENTYQQFNNGLATKYGLSVGDSVDVETGALTRKNGSTGADLSTVVPTAPAPVTDIPAPPVS